MLHLGFRLKNLKEITDKYAEYDNWIKFLTGIVYGKCFLKKPCNKVKIMIKMLLS